MRILVGCECSGAVRRAFAARGHQVVSCDLKPAEDMLEHEGVLHTTSKASQVGRLLDEGARQIHYQGDVRDLLDSWFKFDMGIFFPDCTYLCRAGIHWNSRIKGRAKKTKEALLFVRTLLNAEIDKIVLENPIGVINTNIRQPDQRIHPWQFGHDAEKTTCLWLKGVEPLTIDPDQHVPGRKVTLPSGKIVERWANQTDSGNNKLPPSKTRAADRSRTYSGIALAFAEQWG